MISQDSHSNEPPEPDAQATLRSCSLLAGGRAVVRLLLVEDNEHVAERLRALIGADARVHLQAVAGSVAEALRAIERVAFDVALVDIGLPDGSGLDVIRRIAQLEQQLPLPPLVLARLGAARRPLCRCPGRPGGRGPGHRLGSRPVLGRLRAGARPGAGGGARICADPDLHPDRPCGPQGVHRPAVERGTADRARA